MPRDDLGLLRVLLAEVRAVGPDDGEELEADGRDAAEVPGPRLALEAARHLLDLDPGLEARRVHLLGRRHEDEIDAGLLERAQVARLVARVAVEILAGPELRRVHEDADDDDVALGPRGVDERQMARVQRAHRRDEPDRALARAAERGARLRDRADDLHPAEPAVASESAR